MICEFCVTLPNESTQVEGNCQEKDKLGKKINFVHDAILKNQLGEQTDQESFQKMFKPITTKLDDVALGGLRLPTLPRNHGKKNVSP